MSVVGAKIALVNSNDARATLAKRKADVAAMFDGVASRYDVMNDIMTAGQHRLWRREVVRAVDPKPGQVILDLAAGTGSSSRPFADAGALVVPADLSFGMLAEGRKRQPDLQFINADALQLPFADQTFDAITILYGIRNFEHTDVALRELRRVTKPGGKLVILEFSKPTWQPFGLVYKGFLKTVIPTAAKLFASNKAAYTYLGESILAWPDQHAFAELMARAGWRDVEFKNMSGGIVAIHRGVA